MINDVLEIKKSVTKETEIVYEEFEDYVDADTKIVTETKQKGYIYFDNSLLENSNALKVLIFLENAIAKSNDDDIKEISYSFNQIDGKTFALDNFNKKINGKKEIEVIYIENFIQKLAKELYSEQNMPKDIKDQLQKIASSSNNYYQVLTEAINNIAKILSSKKDNITRK